MATGAVGSTGLDVNSIVSQLMTVERQPLTVLTQRESKITAKMTALSRVQGAVASLQSAAANLARSGLYSGLKAAISADVAAVAVTDANKAVAGTFGLKVNALASAHALASQAMPAAAPVGTGTLTLQLGEVVDGVFTPAQGSATVPITIGADNNTLAGIRDAINAAKLGVTAGLVNDASGTRLTVTANDTGRSQSIRIQVDDSDGNDGDEFGLSRLSFDPAQTLAPDSQTGAGRQLLQTRAAADASFEINGLALTSGSNKVTGAIEGVTIDLRKASPDNASISIERDGASIRGAVDVFIRAYNDLDKLMRDLTAFDAASRQSALLNGDSALRAVQNQIRTVLRTAVAAEGADYRSVSEVGFELNKDGVLSLNASRFDAALSDPAKLARLFASNDQGEARQGVAARFEALARSINGTDGLLPGRTKGLQAQASAITKQQEQLNLRLAEVEKRLRRQYSALDVQLQRMQGISNSLANALTGLPGARKSDA